MIYGLIQKCFGLQKSGKHINLVTYLTFRSQMVCMYELRYFLLFQTFYIKSIKNASKPQTNAIEMLKIGFLVEIQAKQSKNKWRTKAAAFIRSNFKYFSQVTGQVRHSPSESMKRLQVHSELQPLHTFFFGCCSANKNA